MYFLWIKYTDAYKVKIRRTKDENNKNGKNWMGRQATANNMFNVSYVKEKTEP